jgi:hypothetical protein
MASAEYKRFHYRNVLLTMLAGGLLAVGLTDYAFEHVTEDAQFERVMTLLAFLPGGTIAALLFHRFNSKQIKLLGK